jgi:hypothetical protein
MRIGRGIVPPGKIGLVMIAAAVAPVVLRKAKPLAKAVGKGIAKLGEAVERIADNSTIDAQDREAERIRRQASQEDASDKNMNKETNDPPVTPDERTASPIAHEELDAHKAKQAKKRAKPPEAEKKRKEPKAGAEPPQNNPKRARRAPPDIDTA